jgi:hypothetical protein
MTPQLVEGNLCMTVLAAKPSKSAGLETQSGDEIRTGSPLPFGAHQEGEGVNFALFSRHATRVLLELYERPDACSPTRVIELDPAHHRTGDVWHVWVRGISAGQLYAYRIDGPYQPEQGHRFNVHKLLLDPFATALTGVKNWDFEAARGYDSSSDLTDLSFSTLDDANTTAKCVLTDALFDWEEDLPLKHPASDTVIYEAHVRGFTIDPSSGAAHAGTFRGLTAKIPYLQDLGVTAIELMPVQEFNENELSRLNPISKERSGTIGATIRPPSSRQSSPMAPKDHLRSKRSNSGKWSNVFTVISTRHQMLRITRKENGEVVFKVSGQLNAENVAEMKALIAAETKVSHIVFTLTDVTSVDAEAVKFLEKCEAGAIELRECGAYLRERIRRER